MAKRDLTEHADARQWRETMGLTRSALSELSGYSVQSITSFEAGKQTSGDPIDPTAFHRYRLVCAAIHARIRFDWKTAQLDVTRRETITLEANGADIDPERQ